MIMSTLIAGFPKLTQTNTKYLSEIFQYLAIVFYPARIEYCHPNDFQSKQFKKENRYERCGQ